MKEVFTSIKSLISTNINVNDIRRYNNQVSRLSTGKSTLYLPSILIEISNIEYTFRSVKYHKGIADLNIHIVTEDFDDGEKLYDLEEEVNNLLDKYSDGINFEPLLKVSQEVDSDYDNVIVSILTFELHFVDYVVDKDAGDDILLDLDLTTETE